MRIVLGRRERDVVICEKEVSLTDITPPPPADAHQIKSYAVNTPALHLRQRINDIANTLQHLYRRRWD